MRHFINDKEKEVINPMTTTRWSQEYPYTYEGVVEGQLTEGFAAGCVAVGGAQLMKYHNHPEAGVGIIPAYGTHPEKNIDGYEYNWGLMPASLDVNSSVEEIVATSTLILDAGLSCRSGYGPGTSANPKDLADGLKRNFNYDKNLQYVEFKTEGLGYKYSEVTKLVRRDLNMGLPVMVGIAGHFIICEGYNDKDDFYFNWGWGGSPRVGSLKSVGALQVMLGVRPAEKEMLIGGSISTTIVNLTPGDPALISFDVSNVGGAKYQGQIQIILADEFNAPRSYLTAAIDLDLEKEETRNITVPVNFDNGFTFGPRDIQILYSTTSGIPRPLRTDENEILSIKVNSSRAVSQDVYVSQIETVEKVAKGDEFTVNLELVGNIERVLDLVIYLVDSELNEYYELGSISTQINVNESTSLSVPCSTNDVESEVSYFLLVTEKGRENDQMLVPASIPYRDGSVPLSKIYIKNPSVNYGDEVELVSNFDTSMKIYAEYYYETDVQYSISKPSSGMYLIQLSMTDDDGNILSSESITDVTPSDDIKTIRFKLKVPKVEETRVVNLHADYINITNPEKTCYLIPHDSTILNPAKVPIVYRNFYEYIYLSSSLKTSEPMLNPGDSFQVKSDIIYALDYTTKGAFSMNVRAILAHVDGTEQEIGVFENFFGALNLSIPVSIDCKIPEDIVSGDYKLYLRATELSAENGMHLKKINKLNEGVMDELAIRI
jgi:hypothetical protein